MPNSSNLMAALSGLSGGKPESYPSAAPKAKPSPAKKPKVVNLGEKGSFKINHPGGLHTATGTPKGQKIPQAKIVKASQSKSPHVRRMAASAKGLEAMNRGSE